MYSCILAVLFILRIVKRSHLFAPKPEMFVNFKPEPDPKSLARLTTPGPPVATALDTASAFRAFEVEKGLLTIKPQDLIERASCRRVTVWYRC